MKTNWIMLAVLGVAATLQAEGDMRLWYKQAATNWEKQALPIGNGRLGGMIFGGAQEEHVQFNVDSLWTGDENPEAFRRGQTLARNTRLRGRQPPLMDLGMAHRALGAFWRT